MSDSATARPVPCPRCGTDMRAERTKTAIWVGEELFVVENIPAQLCDACMEQFYDEDATDALRRLTESNFPAEKMAREMTVRVFSLSGG